MFPSATLAYTTNPMLWTYTRRNLEDLRVEASFDPLSREYVLVIHRGGGEQHVERLRSEVAFRERLGVLERELAEQQWTHVGPPGHLADAWKLT